MAIPNYKNATKDDKELFNKNRFFITFIPVFFLILQSYFKATIIKETGGIIAFSPESFYWVVRFILIIIFILLLFFYSSFDDKFSLQPNDIYETYRAERNPLLGLRAVACLNVLLGHWFMVVFGPSVPAQSTFEYFLRTALSFSPWCGVWIFFTLSGYLIGKGFAFERHSIGRSGLKRFYKNRILRIFPMYFITVFLVALLVTPSSLDLRTRGGWNVLFETLFFDQMGGGVIGALWSVSAEFQFYIIAPFIFFILSNIFSTSKKCWVYVVFVFLVLSLFSFAKFNILKIHPELWHSRVYFPLLMNLDCFLIGMLTSLFVRGQVIRGIYIKNGLFIGIVLGIMFQVLISIWSFPEMAAYQGYPGSSTRIYFLSFAPALTSIETSILIVLFELSRRCHGSNNLIWKASTMLGTLTYCIYVVHEPILISIRRLFQESITIYESIKIFPFGAFLVFITAFGFYYFVESRFDKLRN